MRIARGSLADGWFAKWSFKVGSHRAVRSFLLGTCSQAKFTLAGEQEYDKLARHLHTGWRAEIKQENHFFDGANGELTENDAVFRLRILVDKAEVCCFPMFSYEALKPCIHLHSLHGRAFHLTIIVLKPRLHLTLLTHELIFP